MAVEKTVIWPHNIRLFLANHVGQSQPRLTVVLTAPCYQSNVHLKDSGEQIIQSFTYLRGNFFSHSWFLVLRSADDMSSFLGFWRETRLFIYFLH